MLPSHSHQVQELASCIPLPALPPSRHLNTGPSLCSYIFQQGHIDVKCGLQQGQSSCTHLLFNLIFTLVHFLRAAKLPN